jgi:hypothetical protein
MKRLRGRSGGQASRMRIVSSERAVLEFMAILLFFLINVSAACF